MNIILEDLKTILEISITGLYISQLLLNPSLDNLRSSRRLIGFLQFNLLRP